ETTTAGREPARRNDMNKRIALVGILILSMLAAAATVLARELPNLGLGRGPVVYEVPASEALMTGRERAESAPRAARPTTAAIGRSAAQTAAQSSLLDLVLGAQTGGPQTADDGQQSTRGGAAADQQTAPLISLPRQATQNGNDNPDDN